MEKQDEKNIDGEIILRIPKVLRIDYKKDGSSKLIDEGDLEVIYVQTQNIFLIKHYDFFYTFHKNIPIFTNSRPSDCTIGKRFVIPTDSNSIAFVFTDHVPAAVVNHFERLLKRKIKLLKKIDFLEIGKLLLVKGTNEP